MQQDENKPKTLEELAKILIELEAQKEKNKGVCQQLNGHVCHTNCDACLMDTYLTQSK